MGGGEDPEVLQEVPQEEISTEGVKKEGFLFDDNKDDYCNPDTMGKTMMVICYHQRADTKERWKKHIEGDDYVPSPPSASSINRSGEQFFYFHEIAVLETIVMLFQFAPGGKIRKRLALGTQIALDR